MEYSDFLQRYIGATRTKHIKAAYSGRMSITKNMYRIIKSIIRPSYEATSKRKIKLPKTRILPRDFIRLDPWEAEYFYSVMQRAKKGIVEIGRFNGGSTFVAACANSYVPIYSVDIEPQNDSLLQHFFDTQNIGRNVELIIGDSQKTKYPQVGEVDVLFVDGDHTYEGCKADIENWYENLCVGGSLVFHDCYVGVHGVQDAVVDFMKDHPELQIVASPFIGAFHWTYPTGSIAHLIKRTL